MNELVVYRRFDDQSPDRILNLMYSGSWTRKDCIATKIYGDEIKNINTWCLNSLGYEPAQEYSTMLKLDVGMFLSGAKYQFRTSEDKLLFSLKWL